jgi:hypothetical protein
MKTLISIQQQYIDTVNAGLARWAHRKGIRGVAAGVGGHAARIVHGAHRKAVAELARLGYSEQMIAQAMRDAKDMAELERLAAAEQLP